MGRTASTPTELDGGGKTFLRCTRYGRGVGGLPSAQDVAKSPSTRSLSPLLEATAVTESVSTSAKDVRGLASPQHQSTLPVQPGCFTGGARGGSLITVKRLILFLASQCHAARPYGGPRPLHQHSEANLLRMHFHGCMTHGRPMREQTPRIL